MRLFPPCLGYMRASVSENICARVLERTEERWANSERKKRELRNEKFQIMMIKSKCINWHWLLGYLTMLLQLQKLRVKQSSFVTCVFTQSWPSGCHISEDTVKMSCFVVVMTKNYCVASAAVFSFMNYPLPRPYNCWADHVLKTKLVNLKLMRTIYLCLWNLMFNQKATWRMPSSGM